MSLLELLMNTSKSTKLLEIPSDSSRLKLMKPLMIIEKEIKVVQIKLPRLKAQKPPRKSPNSKIFNKIFKFRIKNQSKVIPRLML